MWAAEKAIAKSQSEWKEAVTLMKELDLKPKFQSLQAWNWASATVRNYFMFNDITSANLLQR